MELHLTPNQEQQLSRLANHAGKPIEQLLADTALGLLRENDAFLKAVDEGLAAANRGDFIEEEETDARFEKMLRS